MLSAVTVSQAFASAESGYLTFYTQILYSMISLNTLRLLGAFFWLFHLWSPKPLHPYSQMHVGYLGFVPSLCVQAAVSGAKK